MNVLFILCDSLIRDYLGPYHHGSGPNIDIRTPNLDRLAQRSHVFDNHWIGSTPCMPARRELWSGRLEFPWRSWGPLEPWDANWARDLSRADVRTQLITDHANLFDIGAGNYHWHFTGYELIRGHVNDHWESREAGNGSPYERNAGHRTPIESPQQSFAARTLTSVARWLEDNAADGVPWFLMVDEFDPHWPYDPPEPYRSMYAQDAELETVTPPLSPQGLASTDPRIAEATRARYAGKLTMMDHYLGRVLDTLDRMQLWDQTMVILTTDHGEHCGEHDLLGKGHGWCYPEYARIPLMIHDPRAIASAGRCDALTTTVDLHATVLETMGQTPASSCHGRSLLPLLRGQADSVRGAVMFGWWGRGFYATDGRWLVCKAPEAETPKFQYGTWLGEKHTGLRSEPFDRYAEATSGPFMPHIDLPVYRIPADGLAYASADADTDALFDLAEDPACARNQWDQLDQRHAALAMLQAQMRWHAVPQEHYQRLNLSSSLIN